mmetsp:Transcript_27347/g.36582  ORF Transcript_27347/g.36582 Transcript_27347/m.36582 type:complete len:274 (-) Transcript_27347:877-1698(-)
MSRQSSLYVCPSVCLYVTWKRLCYLSIRSGSAVAFLNAGDRVEEVAEGELRQLHATPFRLVAPHESWVARLRQDLVRGIRARTPDRGSGPWLRSTTHQAQLLGNVAQGVSRSFMLPMNQLLCTLQDLLDAVEFDRADLCANGDKVVVPADIDAPDGALLARLNYVDGLASVQIEDDECAFVVAGDQVRTGLGEGEGAYGAGDREHQAHALARLNRPEAHLLVRAAGRHIVHIWVELNDLNVGDVACQNAQRAVIPLVPYAGRPIVRARCEVVA